MQHARFIHNNILNEIHESEAQVEGGFADEDVTILHMQPGAKRKNPLKVGDIMGSHDPRKLDHLSELANDGADHLVIRCIWNFNKDSNVKASQKRCLISLDRPLFQHRNNVTASGVPPYEGLRVKYYSNSMGVSLLHEIAHFKLSGNGKLCNFFVSCV